MLFSCLYLHRDKFANLVSEAIVHEDTAWPAQIGAACLILAGSILLNLLAVLLQAGGANCECNGQVWRMDVGMSSGVLNAVPQVMLCLSLAWCILSLLCKPVSGHGSFPQMLTLSQNDSGFMTHITL